MKPNENMELTTFQFSESKQPVRNILIDNKPYFMAKDVASILGYKNERDAIRQHCRYVVKSDIPHPQNSQKSLEVSFIPESDVYRLIMKSTLPSAQAFEQWIMEEVIPAILKKGYYGMGRKTNNDYIDARNIPFTAQLLNEYAIRMINIDNVAWFSINDVNKALHASTSSNQLAKKLNAVEELAVKIWIFGNTQPAWFASERGLQLILAGSRINNRKDVPLQLQLPW